MTTLGQVPGESASANFEILTKSASALREAGDVDAAIRDYRRALEIRPGWEEGWWLLGTLQYDGDRYSEAIPAFQKVVELLPGAGPAWNFLGLCEFETKNFASSLEHLKTGQALGDGGDPELARVANYHLALLLIRSGEFDRAADLLVSTFGQSQMTPQVKVALSLAMLGVPLVPEEVDPARDALLDAAGEAASAMAQNDAVKALHAFPLLLKSYPSIPYLHYTYGKALAYATRYEEALAEQREEVRISPQSARPRIEASLLELRLRHPDEARRAALEALALAPNSSAAHRALGEALQALGDKKRADQEHAVATSLAPEKPVPEGRIARLYRRQAEPGRQENRQETADLPGSSAPASFEALSRRAAAAQTAGNRDLAIENYERALALGPDWDDGRWNLAMLYYSAGRFPEAISALKNWLQHKPEFGTAWAVMGLSEFEIKDYGNALIHLERGARLGLGGSPEAVRLAKYRLAILFNRNREFESATETIAQDAGSGPLSKEIRFALGMALLRLASLPDQVVASEIHLVESAGEIAALLANSRYELAFASFEALEKDYPAAPFLHYAYGTALTTLSRYEEAEIQLRKELQISPASELPHIRLASLALKRHRPADARPEAERAVELAHDSAEAHYIRGRTCLELGEEQTAVEELELASKLAPGSPEVHFNLAKAYAKAKMPEKADEERAIFARLNALAEKQRGLSGNQAYGGSHDALEFSPSRINANKAPDRPL